MNAEDQFHLGIVTADPDATGAELSAVLGYEWGPEVGGTASVVLPSGETVLELSCRYSVTVPRLELIRSIPGTLWEPEAGSRVHHIGFWSDDVAADSAQLVGRGWATEATRSGPDGAPFFAFHRSDAGVRVELLSPGRAAEPATVLGGAGTAVVSTVGIVTGAGRGMGFACAQRLAATVDTLLAVDLDEASLTAAVAELGATATARGGAVPARRHRPGRRRRARRPRRRTGHPALGGARRRGISPTMADWRRIFAVDLVGSAMLVDTLRPLAVAGTALVCFASMAPILARVTPTPEVAAVLDAPLEPDFLERCRAVLGPDVEDTGTAYAWAKLGVQRLARREAVRLGAARARVCSVSPGIIDTPQGSRRPPSTPAWSNWWHARRWPGAAARRRWPPSRPSRSRPRPVSSTAG